MEEMKQQTNSDSSTSETAASSALSLFSLLPFSYEPPEQLMELNAQGSLGQYASQDVLSMMARAFLEDQDVLMLGRCSSLTLASMRSYSFRRTITVVDLCARRWEAAEVMRVMTTEQRKLLLSMTNTSKKKKKWQNADGVASTIMDMIPRDSKIQIGRFSNIMWREYNPKAASANTFLLQMLHLLPRSIHSLIVDTRPQSLDVIPTMPPGLIQLELRGELMNFPLRSIVLPESLLEMKVHYRSSPHDSSFTAPSRLRSLELHNDIHFNDEALLLPSTLTSLYLSRNVDGSVEKLILPEGLLSLSFGHLFNQPIEKLRLPSTLRKLDIGNTFNQRLRDWNPPLSLVNFQLPQSWRLSGDQLRLPPSLTNFIFSYGYNQPIIGIHFPEALTSLNFGYSFDQPLRHVNFPSSLTSIIFQSRFHQSLSRLDWTPPCNLVSIFFDPCCIPLATMYLPPSLRQLTIGSLPPAQRLSDLTFPPHLESLNFFQQWIEPQDDQPPLYHAHLPTRPLPDSLTSINVRDERTEKLWHSSPYLSKDCKITNQHVRYDY